MTDTATATKSAATKPKAKRKAAARKPKAAPPISLDFSPREITEMSEAKTQAVREKLRAFVLGASAAQLRQLAKQCRIDFSAADVDAMLPGWKKAQLLQFAEKSGIAVPKSATAEAIVATLREHRDQWVPVKEIQSAEPRL